MAREKDVSAKKYEKDIDQARREGYQEGLAKGRIEVLDLLEKYYMSGLPNQETPDRGDEEAKAILTVAQECSAHFRKLVQSERKK